LNKKKEILGVIELDYHVLDYTINFAGTVLVLTLDTDDPANRFPVYVNEKGKTFFSS